MITLFLYNSEGYICYALADNDCILYTTSLYAPKKSTEIYLSHIEHTFASLSLHPSQISRILCTNGPTSFTATRLILSTALGISTPYNIPIACLSTLASLAYNAPFSIPSLWVALPAQKNTLYTQLFTVEYTQCDILVHECSHISVATYPDFERQLATSTSYLIIPHKYREHLTLTPSTTLLASHYAFPSAFALQHYARHAIYSSQPPDACYIRKTDAEENIDAIAHKLGYTQEEVQQLYTTYSLPTTK